MPCDTRSSVPVVQVIPLLLFNTIMLKIIKASKPFSEVKGGWYTTNVTAAPFLRYLSGLMVSTPDFRASDHKFRYLWDLKRKKSPPLPIFIQLLQHQHHRECATLFSVSTCLCVIIHITKNSFSIFIPVEEPANVGILLLFSSLSALRHTDLSFFLFSFYQSTTSNVCICRVRACVMKWAYLLMSL